MNFLIALRDVDVLTIGQALDAMPYGRVVHIVASIQAQITEQERVAEQLKATSAAAPKEPEAPAASQEPASLPESPQA